MIHATSYIIEFILATLVATVLFFAYVLSTFRIRPSLRRAKRHFKNDLKAHRLDSE